MSQAIAFFCSEMTLLFRRPTISLAQTHSILGSPFTLVNRSDPVRHVTAIRSRWLLCQLGSSSNSLVFRPLIAWLTRKVFRQPVLSGRRWC